MESECNERNELIISSHTLVSNGTVMRIIKVNLFPVPVRLHSASGYLNFVLISPYFAIFKNVVHSLEPGETPGYSAPTRLRTMCNGIEYRKIL